MSASVKAARAAFVAAQLPAWRALRLPMPVAEMRERIGAQWDAEQRKAPLPLLARVLMAQVGRRRVGEVRL